MEETLGKRIVANRRRLGLTQDALAEQLGVTAQAVSKWENDQSCPDITMLPKLAEVFDITTDELLGLSKKDVHMSEVIPEKPAAQEAPDIPQNSIEDSINWTALRSPGAAFGFWLFLTGLVALIDVVRLPPYDLADIGLADIAICCGVFTFGLFCLFRRFSLLRLGCTMAGGVFVFHLITEPGIADMDWFIPLAAGLALFGLDMLIDTIRRPKKATLNMGHNGHFPMVSSIGQDGPKNYCTYDNGHFPMVSSVGRDGPKNYCTYDGEHFSCATCFGEGNHVIQLPRLSGGKGEVSFGELTLDLSGCGEIADNCTIDLDCSFGELVLLVPRQYRVEAASKTAFGAVQEMGSADADALATIFLNCNVSFGDITIRHI